jgi:hypothetical protein
LRLNQGSNVPMEGKPFAQWRKIRSGTGGVVVGVGPVVENIFHHPLVADMEIWVVSIFPLGALPDDLVTSLNNTRKLVVAEEHNGECGLRETLSYHLINRLTGSIRILSLSAKGYPSGRYGDQKWHQSENSLLGEKLTEELRHFREQ